jgi:hypothetical protein
MERVVARLADVVVVALRCVRTRPQRHNACRRFKLSPVAICPLMTSVMTAVATNLFGLATNSDTTEIRPDISYDTENDLCDYGVSWSILPFTVRSRRLGAVDVNATREGLTI